MEAKEKKQEAEINKPQERKEKARKKQEAESKKKQQERRMRERSRKQQRGRGRKEKSKQVALRGTCVMVRYLLSLWHTPLAVLLHCTYYHVCRACGAAGKQKNQG